MRKPANSTISGRNFFGYLLKIILAHIRRLRRLRLGEEMGVELFPNLFYDRLCVHPSAGLAMRNPNPCPMKMLVSDYVVFMLPSCDRMDARRFLSRHSSLNLPRPVRGGGHALFIAHRCLLVSDFSVNVFATDCIACSIDFLPHGQSTLSVYRKFACSLQSQKIAQRLQVVLRGPCRAWLLGNSWRKKFQEA